MKILLVYPEYPATFWSWKRIMKIIRRKAAFPPLGLLTIAALLPKNWAKKLVDLNVRPLRDKDIKWADVVFISAMITQTQSAKEVIARCKGMGKKVVAGGPVFTTGHEQFQEVDHFVLGEAEDLMPQLVQDLSQSCAKRIYVSSTRPDIAKAPIPQWNLIRHKDYVSLAIQDSRGCPYNCEFCDIIVMNGRVPRVKESAQFIAEIQAIYQTGFRGMVLVVDDNFIGNKAKVKKTLVELIAWQKKHGYPFSFSTEASINLADDKELMRLMVEAGFDQVFLGLETPSPEGLAECGKVQNTRRNVVESVKEIQRHGLHTLGGFIVGFDSDKESIFDQMVRFVQESGVVVAMVGLLQALPKTKLHSRLHSEGRIVTESTGNNTDAFLNFVPKMPSTVLLAGYKQVIGKIYSHKMYYERMMTFLREYNPAASKACRTDWISLRAFALSVWYIGIGGSWFAKEAWLDRYYYWKTLMVAGFRHRKAFPAAVAMLIWGWHLQKVAQEVSKS